MACEKEWVCKRCSMCCIDAFMNLWEITEDNKDKLLDRAIWLKHHRCDPIKIKQNGKDFLAVSVPLTCRHLKHKEGGYSCGIYDDRPELCKKYNCGR